MADKLKENLHSGHRQRVRDEFLKNGFSPNVPDHKMLELLLFYSIPRKDTNPIAHKLLNHFGSFSALLDASPEEIEKVEGVGKSTAALLKLIMPIARRYLDDADNIVNTIPKISDICKYITNKYAGVSEEMFAVTSLNANGTVVGFDIVCQGEISIVQVPVRKIIEIVLQRKAVGVIISHNHPKGIALPSSSDIAATEKISEILNDINVKLVDHIIVSGKDCISFYQSENIENSVGHLYDEYERNKEF